MKPFLLRIQSRCGIWLFLLAVGLLHMHSASGQIMPTGTPTRLNLSGPSQVCAGTTVNFSVYEVDGSCGSWSWDAGDGTVALVGSLDGRDVAITWNTAGTRRVAVYASCQDYDSGDVSYPTAYIDVNVVAPPTNQFITVLNNQAANITPTSASVCPDRGIVLMPPTGATNCVWSSNPASTTNPANGGGLQVNSYGAAPYSSVTYTLRYQLPGSCAVAPLTFAVNVAANAGSSVVTGTERFGSGSLALTVQNHQPTYIYTWYEAATGPAVAYTGGPTFNTPNLTQSRSYYLAVTSCEEGPREEVKATLRRVQILVNGQVPTQTVTGTSVLLQADPAGGQYTWLRNGELIDGASGPQLTVTEAGSYTVRLAGGTGPEYESSPVEVLPLTQLKDWTVLKPQVTNPQQVASLNASERRYTVTYANGLGQPVQQLAAQAGPNQEDIVQHLSYAGTSTTTQAFLPFPVAATTKPNGDYETDPLTKLNAYYLSKGGLPFNTGTVDASPLGRPLEQTQTGTAWAGHSSRVSYAANTASEVVRRWQGFDGSQSYAAGQLSKEISLDPDNRRTEIFKDQLGRVVLQRKVNGSQNIDTYTVYADAGYVQLIIPPAAVEAMGATGLWNIQDAVFKDRWLYQYVYDDRGRVVERKFPGAAPVYLVYDAFDRPILVQDGNHRTTSGGQWLFTKFDAQNRPVVEGIWQDGRARTDVQRAADAFIPSKYYEIRSAGSYTTGNTFPAVQDGTSGAVLLSMTFYDDYDMNADGTADYALAGESRLSSAEQPVQTTQTRGLTTVTRRRVVQPGCTYGIWLTTVLLYDEYGNLIQKQSNNLLEPGASLLDRTTLVYRDHGFVPQVLRSVKKQSYGTAAQAVVRNRFAYDAAGHLLQTWQQHERNGTVEPELLLSSNRYTGLGELTQKMLHSRDQGTKFLQTEDFAYNLHGQLVGINNGSLKDNRENDLFGLVLLREVGGGLMGNTARYDGGISAVTWMVHNGANPQTPPERERSYRFAYDGIGRLTDATYAARINPWEPWTLEQGAYDEKAITYDANGNIRGLKRYTQQSANSAVELIDDMYMDYGSSTYTWWSGPANSGNRLLGAYDYQGDNRGFKNSTTTGWNSYTYDANGSMLHDGNKGVDYVYNALNKVEKQSVGTPNLVFTYDASGTVLRKVTTTATAVKTETYVDGLVYESSPSFSPAAAALRSVPTPEGRAVVVQLADAKFTYEYHLRDHLGNLRVAFRAQAGTEDLKLSSEASEKDGEYPNFSGIADTRSTDITPAREGNYVASVVSELSSGVSGPSIAIPVAHQDHIKVRVYYQTPNGVQYYRPALAPTRATGAAALAWTVAPVLLPTPANTEHPSRAMPGVQVSVSGLIGHLFARSRQPVTSQLVQPAQTPPLDAYLQWTLTNANGTVVRTGMAVAPVTTQSQTSWTPLNLPLDIDLSSEDTRTGTLRIREMNDGSQPVYFDSLTITHPQDQALVSQENHYYPFGMAMTGVAVNTTAQPQVSKDQFNGGSELQDELLGSQTGIYSTFYRDYDPATGRFQGVDPMADTYADSSPYSFSFNDPINFNDPNGDEPIIMYGQVVNQRSVITGNEEYSGSSINSQDYQTILAGGSVLGGYSMQNTVNNAAWGNFLTAFAQLLTGARNATYSNGLISYSGSNSSIGNNDNTWTIHIPVNLGGLSGILNWNDPVNNKRISELDERLQASTTTLLGIAHYFYGEDLRITQGHRSIEEQNRYYAQGRTTPGPVITYAKGGQSYHQYGLAFDVVVMKNGQPNWNKTVSPEVVWIATKILGFEWGGNWGRKADPPHFQMTFGQTWQQLIKKQ